MRLSSFPSTRATLSLALLLSLGFATHIVGKEIAGEHDATRRFTEAEGLRSEQREEANRRAVERYRDAANLWRDLGNFRQAAVALRNAGEILSLLGDTSGALVSFKEALRMTRIASADLEQAKILNDLAYLQFIVGDTTEAHRNCLAALHKGRKLKNRAVEAEALSNLGEVFYNLGDLLKAQENQNLSLAIWTELGNHRGQAVSLIALGYYEVNLGEPEKALRSYAAALTHAQAAQDLGVEALARLAIGNIKRKLGEKQEALASYEAAKQIALRIGDQTSLAIVAGGLGYVALDLGDYSSALVHMQKAVELFEHNGKRWGAAEGRMDLGKIHHALGNDERALEYIKEALALFKSLSMRRFESLALRDIGMIYYARGEWTSALKEFQRALTLMRVDQDKRQTAYTLNYIGQVYERLKEKNKALSYYQNALPLSQLAADREGEALTRYNLAHLYRDLGSLTAAKQEIETVLSIAESQRYKVRNQGLRTTYFATVRNQYDLYIDILMRLHQKSEAFAASETARARTFLELLLEAQANLREGADPSLLSKERLLNEAVNTKAQYQLQLLAARKKDEAARVDHEVQALLAELERVRDEIRAASPRFAALSEARLLNCDDVQQRLLDDETVLLEYALGDDRSYVWVITRSSFSSHELRPRVEIENSARRLRELIVARQIVYGESLNERTARQTNADAEIPAAIVGLSQLVLGPLAGKLGKKRVLVVADGALQYIPFQMLTDPDSGSSLLAAHEIIYAPSASTLTLLQEEISKRKPAAYSVAVLADPVFEIDDPRVKRNSNSAPTPPMDLQQALRDVGVSPDGIQIPRLIASAGEADGIMAVAPWRMGLKAVGFAANRERVLGPELANYRILHFATHGIVNSERPELSGIVLSLFDSEGRVQNGFLRLHDIYNLHLPADLVVLSACSTGLGKEVRGEGLIGLTRGFMYAGASGVIASLWKVDDDATAELMKHFYEALFQKGMSPAAALRAAQLALSQNQRWQSPYYWAGFVIQGQYAETQKFTAPFPSGTQLAVLGILGAVLLPILIVITRLKRCRHK